MNKEKKGKELRRCRSCGNNKGLVRKYGLNLCRRCFKDSALRLGFKKYD